MNNVMYIPIILKLIVNPLYSLSSISKIIFSAIILLSVLALSYRHSNPLYFTYLNYILCIGAFRLTNLIMEDGLLYFLQKPYTITTVFFLEWIGTLHHLFQSIPNTDKQYGISLYLYALVNAILSSAIEVVKIYTLLIGSTSSTELLWRISLLVPFIFNEWGADSFLSYYKGPTLLLNLIFYVIQLYYQNSYLALLIVVLSLLSEYFKTIKPYTNKEDLTYQKWWQGFTQSLLNSGLLCWALFSHTIPNLSLFWSIKSINIFIIIGFIVFCKRFIDDIKALIKTKVSNDNHKTFAQWAKYLEIMLFEIFRLCLGKTSLSDPLSTLFIISYIQIGQFLFKGLETDNCKV